MAASGEGVFKRFMKTKWFRVFYVFLIALASSVVMISTGCLSAFFIPLVMFAIPYYLKEKNVRRYLINGVVVLLLCLVMVNLFRTVLIVSSPQPDLSSQAGNVTLSRGGVYPFRGEGGEIYNFSVIYNTTGPLMPTNVHLTLKVFEYASAETKTYAMTGDTSRDVSLGWVYYVHVPLPEGVYFFNFTAVTTWSSGSAEVVTPFGFGPINASWTLYSSALATLVLIDMMFPFTLYLIVIGMYWWAGRAKVMRGPSRVPSDQEAGGFECTNCGAEVSTTATRCHRCGAIFEEEEPPVVRAKKIEKGRETEVEEGTSISQKDSKE